VGVNDKAPSTRAKELTGVEWQKVKELLPTCTTSADVEAALAAARLASPDRNQDFLWD
jgi:hypothetical protein